MKSRSHRYNIIRPKPRHRHKWDKVFKNGPSKICG